MGGSAKAWYGNRDSGVSKDRSHTRILSGEAPLCRIGDLKITPLHPVVALSPLGDAAKWTFPADVVYSVLLRPNNGDASADGASADAHTILVGDVWCVTLRHGITMTVPSSDGDVRAHAFLGDYDRVLRNLLALDGFHDADGVVRCAGTRGGGADGQICVFVGEDDITVTHMKENHGRMIIFLDV